MQREFRPSAGWWYARFRIKWPEDKEPSWHIDLLMAHRVVAPALQQYHNSIPLWRFHRRAVRDAEGHQFSVTFYSTQETAAQIFSTFRADPLLKKMKKSGVIIKDLYEDTGRVTAPNIEDTSDGHWSPQIRKSWPFFVMGVCQMWLSLIGEITERIPLKKRPSSVQTLLGSYRQVNETIKTLRREQGCHSMLHHLNAIFGYEPVFVQEVQLKRF